MYISPKLNVRLLEYFGGGKYFYTYFQCTHGIVYDTVGISTAVSVMSVVQSEFQFSTAVDIWGCFTNTLSGRCIPFHSDLLYDAGAWIQNNSTSVVSNKAITHVASMLPVVKVKITGRHVTNALIDSGSSNSFISAKLTDSLNLRGTKTMPNMSTMNSVTRKRTFV